MGGRAGTCDEASRRSLAGASIERHCGVDEILQGRLIDLVAFVDVEGAPEMVRPGGFVGCKLLRSW